MVAEIDYTSERQPKLGEHFKASHSQNDGSRRTSAFMVSDLAQLQELVARNEISQLVYLKRLESLVLAQQAEIAAAHETIEKLGGELATRSRELAAAKEAEAAAEATKRMDPLTGLPNRGAFDERLSAILADNDNQNNPNNAISIVYLDIDGLKQTNDNYGHTVGDKLILTATKLLSERLRGDDEIFRVGGDELILIMKGSPESIEKRMLKMQADLESMHIRANVAGEWKDLPVWGFSFGIQQVDRNQSAEANYKAADASMYKNKEQRKLEQSELRAERLAMMDEDKKNHKAYLNLPQAIPANDSYPSPAPLPPL